MSPLPPSPSPSPQQLITIDYATIALFSSSFSSRLSPSPSLPHSLSSPYYHRCEGTGCDECQNITPILASQHTTPLPQTTLTQTRSVVLPTAFDSKIPISVSEDDVVAWISKKIHAIANKLWLSFNDAEVLIRYYNWDQNKLQDDWMADSDGVLEKCGFPRGYGSEPPTGVESFLDPNTIYTTMKGSKAAPVVVLQRTSSMNDDGGDESTCPICYCDYPQSQMTVLPCGHSTCSDCLDLHIKAAVDDTHIQSIHVGCPHTGLIDESKPHTNDNVKKCPYTLPYGIVYTSLRRYDINNPPTITYVPFALPTVIKDSANIAWTDTTWLLSTQLPQYQCTYNAFAPRFRRWFLDYFVEQQRRGADQSRGHFRQCPSSHSCPLFIYIPPTPQFSTRSPIFSSLRYTLTSSTNNNHICPCGMVQCVSCGVTGGHFPATCSIAKRYAEVTDPEYLSTTLIRATSKNCPKCNTSITKDKNCNHTTCVKCNFHFCYLCKGEWSSHRGVFSCDKMASSKLESKASKEYEDVIASHMNIKRILLFHGRAGAYEALTRKYLRQFALTFGSPQTNLQTHVLNRAFFSEFPGVQSLLQSFWFSASLLYWTFAVLSFLPRDSTTRVMRSQQALCLGALASATTKSTELMTLLPETPDSIHYQSFRDSFAFLHDYTERTAKAFVVDTENRIQAAAKVREAEAITNAMNDGVAPVSPPTSEQSTSPTNRSRAGSENTSEAGSDGDKNNDSSGDDDGDNGGDTDDDDDADNNGNNDNNDKKKKKNKRKKTQDDAVPEELEWACTQCGCIHLPTTSDLLFDDITSADGTSVLVDITEKRGKMYPSTGGRIPSISHSQPLARGLAQFKGVATVPTGGSKKNTKIVVCANCTYCMVHGDIDCRACFPR